MATLGGATVSGEVGARGRVRGGAVCALVIAALLCPQAGGPRAEDGAALEFLLGEGRRSQAAPRAVAPAPAVRLAPAGGPAALFAPPSPARHASRAKARPGPSHERARPGPRMSYASLPGARADRPDREAAPKRAARPAPQDPTAALLSDATLRPGDIAVFPDGPKVFKGGHAPFKRGAFEDLRRPGAVSAATRQAVLALGAAPVRRIAPAVTRAAPAPVTVAEARPAPSGVRVVYPSR